MSIAPNSSNLTPSSLKLENQWNDFLLRKVDPYATAKYETLLSWLENPEGKTALVVGSGSGEFAALLALTGIKTKAIDIDEASVELTRQTAKSFGVEVETEVATLQQFPFSTRFDLVVATDVIEHIEDDKQAAKMLKALTLPGGKLVITVPALPQLFGYHDEILGHFRRYTRKSLRQLFDPLVKVEKIKYYGFFLIPVALLISRILRRPYPLAQVGSAQTQKGFLSLFIRSFFAWEKNLNPPAGTSLLMIAHVDS